MPSNYDLTVWKVDNESDLRTPSGQLCRVKELGLQEMAELGVIDQMDTLGMLVEEKHIKRVQGKRPQDKKLTKAQQAAKEQGEITKMLKDKKKFGALVTLLDKVAATCVVEPVVENPWVPVDENDPEKGERKLTRSERLDAALYADVLPFNDKMTIFEFAFKGMGELESFREGSTEDVAALPDVEESEEESG